MYILTETIKGFIYQFIQNKQQRKMKHEKQRQKRRHTWKANHLRKHRFSFKGISWKGAWYYDRSNICLEDHLQRRALEKLTLQKIVKGCEEEDLYFPTKWRNTKEYWY